jgi:plastocyanin
MRSVLLALVSAGLVMGCGASYDLAGPPGGGSSNAVDAVGTSAWSPSHIVVSVGGTVTFRNGSSTVHNVRFDQVAQGHPDDVPDFAAAAKVVTFGVAGTFPYHCGIHPGMVGEVVVEP